MQNILALIWLAVALICTVEELDPQKYTGEKRMEQLFVIFLGLAFSVIAEAVHSLFKLI